MWSLLIHTRSSYHPSADFNSAPSTRWEPDEPTATADMMRPPAARRIERNRLIVPIEVVYGASREVT